MHIWILITGQLVTQAAAALDHSDVGSVTAGVAGLSFEEGLRFEEEQRAAAEPQALPPWACAWVAQPPRGTLSRCRVDIYGYASPSDLAMRHDAIDKKPRDPLP